MKASWVREKLAFYSLEIFVHHHQSLACTHVQCPRIIAENVDRSNFSWRGLIHKKSENFWLYSNSPPSCYSAAFYQPKKDLKRLLHIHPAMNVMLL